MLFHYHYYNSQDCQKSSLVFSEAKPLITVRSSKQTITVRSSKQTYRSSIHYAMIRDYSLWDIIIMIHTLNLASSILSTSTVWMALDTLKFVD